MTWPFRTLRARLVVAFAAIAVLTAGTAAGVTALQAREVVLGQAEASAVAGLRASVEPLAPDLLTTPDQRTLALLNVQLGSNVPDSSTAFAASFDGAPVGAAAARIPESLVDAARDSSTALAQRVEIDGTTWLATAVPVLTTGADDEPGPPSGLVVYSTTPLAAQEAVVGGILGGSVAAAVPTILLSMLLALLLAGALLRPIRTLHGTVEQLSVGDLGLQVPADDPGEVGDLARAFNTMSTRLHAEHEAVRAMEERARRFSADVSHELRTPLAAMTAVAGVLADEATRLPADAAEAALLVAHETGALARLVDDLIEMSRFDAGTAALRLDETQLGVLLRHTLSLRDWSDRVETDVDQELRVRVDPRRFDVVVANLVGNAVRHAGADATIRLSAHARAGSLLVEVIDDGPGIPDELRARVFDRFVKGDPARGRSEGSGLGLSIALENVTLHGGTLLVFDAEGGGTRFTVELPGAVL